jgi:hypothetical protein
VVAEHKLEAAPGRGDARVEEQRRAAHTESRGFRSRPARYHAAACRCDDELGAHKARIEGEWFGRPDPQFGEIRMGWIE